MFKKKEGRTKSFTILPGAFYGHGARFATSFSKITPEGENDTRNVTLNQVGKRTDPIPREVILVFFMWTLGFMVASRLLHKCEGLGNSAEFGMLLFNVLLIWDLHFLDYVIL